LAGDNRRRGLAALFGLLASCKSGGHVSPAVTLGVAASSAKEFVPGIPVGFASISTYVAAEFVGTFISAVLGWVTYQRLRRAESVSTGVRGGGSFG
jgi:glycerol uptake facilitator protein